MKEFILSAIITDIIKKFQKKQFTHNKIHMLQVE